MVATSHFIDENWCLHRKIISFKPVPDHKAEIIADRLKNCMLEWGIDNIFTINVDNANANDSAVKNLKTKLTSLRDDALVLGREFMHVRYCAHILNLIAKDGLSKMKGSVVAIRNAIKYFRSSDTQFRSFEMRVDMDKKVTRGSLVLDVVTRWNSTYLMLFAALKFRSTFQILANENSPYYTYFLEEENGKKREGLLLDVDWDKASGLVRFLDLFYESTLAFSAFKTVTSTSCYDEICTIEANLILLNKDPDLEMHIMGSPMHDKFDKYWGGLDNINTVLIVVSVFDPRRKMAFATLCFERKQSEICSNERSCFESLEKALSSIYHITQQEKGYVKANANRSCK